MVVPAGRAIRGGTAPFRRRARYGRILVLALAVFLPHAAFGAARPELVEVRSATHPGFTRVVLETDLAVPFSIENRSRAELPAIEVQFRAAATAPRIGSARAPVTGIRIEQVDDAHTHAVFVVGDAVDVWTNRLEDPPRIVLDLRAAPPLAERVRQDPEDLTDRPYQIVVEPEQAQSPTAAPEPIESAARHPDAPSAGPSVAPAPPVSTAPADAAVRTPPVAASPDPSGATNGLAWPRILFAYAPWSWIALAWLAVALVLLVIARLWRSREPDLERLPLERSGPPPAATRPVAPPLVREAPVAQRPVLTEDEAARPTAEPEPTAAANAAEEPVPASAAEPPGAAVPDFLKVLRSLDRRIARLESEMAGSREFRESLVAQSAAQAEDLRVQRAAVARLTRQPRRARPSAPPPSSS